MSAPTGTEIRVLDVNIVSMIVLANICAMDSLGDGKNPGDFLVQSLGQEVSVVYLVMNPIGIGSLD